MAAHHSDSKSFWLCEHISLFIYIFWGAIPHLCGHALRRPNILGRNSSVLSNVPPTHHILSPMTFNKKLVLPKTFQPSNGVHCTSRNNHGIFAEESEGSDHHYRRMGTDWMRGRGQTKCGSAVMLLISFANHIQSGMISNISQIHHIALTQKYSADLDFPANSYQGQLLRRSESSSGRLGKAHSSDAEHQ